MSFPVQGCGQVLVIAVGDRVETSTQVSFKHDVQGLRAEIFVQGPEFKHVLVRHAVEKQERYSNF